jgi:signal-transduction protein with cAMP-binding, CBS, and nucleotidyltransferase domain
MDERYVGQIMARPVEIAAPETPIREIAETMIRHTVSAVVVVDDTNRFAGLVTATDFVRLVHDDTVGDQPDAPVSSIMRTDVETTTRQTLATEVAATMLDQRIHHVPVLKDGEVVGMVSTQDLVAQLV